MNELAPLTRKELELLPLGKLVSRMDSVLAALNVERYGAAFAEHINSRLAKVSEVHKSAEVLVLSEKNQCKVVDCAFRFLLQMEMVSTSYGIGNRVLYNDKHLETDWHSPLFQMQHSTLTQYQIIGSRIALECFFELIYVAKTGERIKGDSKFKEIKKWLQDKTNPYRYFVPIFADAFKFDRTHRTPEVHGTSAQKWAVLSLMKPSSDAMNRTLTLSNGLENVWRPLVKLLNKEPLWQIPYAECSHDYIENTTIQERTAEQIDAFLDNLLGTGFN